MSASTTRSILAPLTTTFTPPPDCTTYGAIYNNPSNTILWQGQSCSGGFPHDVTTCWPPALVTHVSYPLGGWGFYSPGLICPVGYTPACTQIGTASGASPADPITSSYSFQFPPIAGETAIGCCPSGLSCTYRYADGHPPWQRCGTQLSTSSLGVGVCSSSAATYKSTAEVNFGPTPVTLFGPMIQIVHQSTESSSPSNAAATTTNANNPSASPNSNENGLSTGAKIGIGVGVPLGIILLAAFGAFIFFRRRKLRREAPLKAPYELGSQDKKAEPLLSKKAEQLRHETPSQEATGIRLNELDSTPSPALYELSEEGSAR